MKIPENKRPIILFIVLVFIMVYYIIDSGMFSNDSTKNPVMNLTRSISGSGNAADLGEDDIHRIIELASVTDVRWENDWGNDPFFYISPESLNTKSRGSFINEIFGTVAKATSAVGLNLTGISWSGNSGFAIINGQPAQVDDVISGHRVEEITKNYVILKQGSKTIRLTLDDN